MWRNPALFGEEAESYGCTAAEADTFVRTLAEHLGVVPDDALPAFEDVFYYL